MKKIFIFLFFLSYILAQNIDTDKQYFTARLIEMAKEKARANHSVLVVMENKENAILVFIKQEKFEGIRLQISRKRAGMSLKGAEFTLVDKASSNLLKQQNPERYHSCYADANSVRVSKDTLYMERSVVIKTTAEFFEKFYQGKDQKNKSFFLNVQILNYSGEN